VAEGDAMMNKGVLFWLLGIPVPFIVLLLLFWR
jgi:hypothetical protein